jgi:predicted small lipoprotein YifL
MKKTAASVGGRLIALAITLTVLAGCGQKGPLTLPKHTPAPVTPAAPASAASR